MKTAALTINLILGAVYLAIPHKIFAITDAGILSGNYVAATGINSSGQVVGTSGGSPRAFISSGGALTTLPTLGADGYGTAIDDSGRVVGYSGTGTQTHAFLYSGGVTKDLGTLGGNYSMAYDINNSGQVVGRSATVASVQRAFLYSEGSMVSLGTLGGRESGAYGINNFGQVVGWSSLSGEHYVDAFLYSDGVMHDLGSLGGRVSSANAINDSGQIVGYSMVMPDNSYHAFLYSAGTMTDLGKLGGVGTGSEALDINNNGQVVGWSTTNPNGGYSSAFLYSGDLLIDLNYQYRYLLHYGGSPGFYHLTSAMGINDTGQIVGVGQFFDGTSTTTRTFILDLRTDPISVPDTAATLMLLAISFLSLTASTRRFGLGHRIELIGTSGS